MFNPKNILRQCLLAVALFSSAVTAMAGPTYHVDINTTGLSGTGALDFYLTPGLTALPLNVTLSNFSGNFGAVDTGISGDFAIGPNGSFSLSNDALLNAYLYRSASLGSGPLSFDVAFSGAFLDTVGNEGSVFSLALYDANNNVIDNGDGIAIFNLLATSPTVIELSSFARANVSVVPEPSDMLLMLTGLGLVGFTVRRRKAPAR
jgi:hypothetical protein